MNRNSTLSVLIALSLSVLLTVAVNGQVTYVDHGSAATYNLDTNDSLYVQNGAFTGHINSFNKNAKITVASGASFQPASFNNPKGILRVFGNAKFNSFSSNKYFILENRGITEITGSTAMNGGTQSWNNYFGATLKFSGTVSMNSDAVLVNDGTITGTSDFTVNSGSVLTNNNIITLNGAFSSNGGQFNNLGKLESGDLTFNSGTAFTNNCRLIINGSFTNNASLVNDGLIWIPAQYSSATLTNTGTITGTANGKVKVKNFINYGTLNGKGYYYFTGTTLNTGTVGVSGSTTDSIKIYDATRFNPNTIFDLQFGTVRANATFSSLTAPDTVFAYTSCSTTYLSMMSLLPVKWNFFYVNVSRNTPVLSWSSEQDPGTVFEIQRSYNGADFTATGTIVSKAGKMDYSFEDAAVNAQAGIVYYRIRAIELSGEQKFTDTKTVRFYNQKGVSVQTMPNPFTSQFSINYQSEETVTLVIKVYNMSGQLQASKIAMVSKGFNSIAVTEAASFPKGIYVVQLSSENNLVATEKIVKQ